MRYRFTLVIPCVVLIQAIAVAQPVASAGDADDFDHVLENSIAQADVNHDGMMSREESRAMGERTFQEMDSNRDGKVTREEVYRYHQRKTSAATDVVQDPKAIQTIPLIEMGDTNRDGMLTHEEYMKAIDKGFRETDANGDGIITKKELANYIMEKIRKMQASSQSR